MGGRPRPRCSRCAGGDSVLRGPYGPRHGRPRPASTSRPTTTPPPAGSRRSSACRTSSHRCSCGAVSPRPMRPGRSSPPASAIRSTRSAACARARRASSTSAGRGARITVHGDYDVDGVSADRGARARVAHGRRRRRLVLAEPDRRRLRARRWLRSPGWPLAGRSCSSRSTARSPRSTRWPPPAPRASTSSSPIITRRAPTGGCRTRRSSTRGSAATRVRSCAPRASRTSSPARCSRRRRGAHRRRGRPRRRRARHGRRLRPARRREPAARPRGAARAGLDAQAGPAGADGGIPRRSERRRRRGGRLPPRAADQRGRAPPSRRRRAGAADDRTTCGARAAIAAELDAVNTERRDVETRILFEAEAQVAATPPGAAGIRARRRRLASRSDRHRASRIAERHHRPAVLIALDGEEGTGSGRSIPAFDLLGGLERRRRTSCATAATAPRRG